MTGSIYDSERLAAGYARRRPPVHRTILEAVSEYLQLTEPRSTALDVGCGAGLSTAALENTAETVVGLEPVQTMLRYAPLVAPGALWVIGRAEQLPFRAGRFSLVTAAGSLNYTDLDLFLPEARRVLTDDGVLVIYDFSPGRRLRDRDRLDKWYSEFEHRYPSPPGYDLKIRDVPYERHGLQLAGYQELEVAIPMSIGSYLSYVLTEANVEWAISRGEPEARIQAWCEKTLSDVFGGRTLDVLFDAYIAYVRKADLEKEA